MTSYEAWIDAYVARHGGDVWMKCLEACEEMCQAFPELELVKGIAISPHGTRLQCALGLRLIRRRPPAAVAVVDDAVEHAALVAHRLSFSEPRGRFPPVSAPGTART